MQRTIKISGEAYQALSHQSEVEKKPMEEIASAIICATFAVAPVTVPDGPQGESYDPKTGKRIFRK